MSVLADLGLRTAKTVGLGESYACIARREHRCDLCDFPIPKGDAYWSWSLAPGMCDSDYWFTAHIHAVCYQVFISSEWAGYPDDGLPDPGEFRSELLTEVVSAQKGLVVWP